MTQRLYQARQDARRGRNDAALGVLRSGLLLVDPARDAVALDVPTAQTAVLLARISIAVGDPVDALPWASWGYRSLRMLCGSTALQTRAALAVLAAAHRDVGDHRAAAHAYSDLVRHHTQAEGSTAVSTLVAQTDLAVVLHEAGHCDQAQQLLSRTITTHRCVHRDRLAQTRMVNALARMRTTCASHDHGTPTPRAAPTPRLQPSTITCLECGNSYAALATHLSRIHKINAAEYRRRHNLPHTPLTSLATSRMRLAAQRQRDSHEPWTARRISALRRALGVSQQRFAILCGVTSNTVRNWETDRATPRPRARLRLHQLDTTQQTPPVRAHMLHSYPAPAQPRAE